MYDADTIVVGAGISGLAYAHARGDEGVLVLEASERAGGLVHTIASDRLDGLRFEGGPETVSDSTGAVGDLIDALGLAKATMPADATKRFVVRRGVVREVPASPRLLTSPFLSPLDVARLFTEPLRATKTALNGSVADFITHRLGKNVLDRLVDPMIGGIHAGDPRALSVRACFPRLVEGVERNGSIFGFLRAAKRERAGSAATESGTKRASSTPWKPRGGMQVLTDALARAVGERLRTNTPVRRVERAGDGWSVELDDGRLRARRLVLALPGAATARLLHDVAPDAAGALATLRSESLVGVVRAFRASDVAHALDGFGYLVPFSETKDGERHLGTLFSSTLDRGSTPDGVVALRTLIGGARDPRAVERSDDELLALARAGVDPLLGIRGEPLAAHVVRYSNALPRYDLEHLARVERVEAGLPPGIAVLGNHRVGIGLSALADAARRLASEHARPTVASNEDRTS